MAAALAGKHTSLDTVVNTSCDMLTACELADDLVRAKQWCRVIDDFVQQFGCPYLYAECRVIYGRVLTACGRWAEAADRGTVVPGRPAPGPRRRGRREPDAAGMPA